jgi:uncharacterized membrane protein YfcA
LDSFLASVLFLLFGLAGGFLGGMLGVGGGIIFVPILTHFLRSCGISGDTLVKCVLANSMLAIVFTGVAASYNQFRQGTYYWKPVCSAALAGVISSLLTTYFIAKGSWYNKESFSLVFISLLILASVRTFLKPSIHLRHKDVSQICLIRFSYVGFAAGIVTALSGLGGGIVMVPAFSSILRIDLKKSISISTGVIPFFALPLTAFYLIEQPLFFPENLYHIGYIVPQFVLPLGFGVVFASKWGVRVGSGMSEAKLQIFMLLLIAGIAVKMLWEAFIH